MQFSDYERDFNSLCTYIRDKTKLIAEKFGEERQALVSSSRKMIEDATELLQSMEVAIREIPPGERATSQRALDDGRATLARLKKELNMASSRLPDESKMRAELFGRMEAGQADVELGELDSKERLVNNTKRLDQAGDALQDILQTGAEAEDVGTSTMNELARQRSNLTRSRDRSSHIEATLEKSKGILRGMLRRMKTNKLITVLIIFVLLVLIGAVIYLLVRPYFTQPAK